MVFNSCEMFAIIEIIFVLIKISHNERGQLLGRKLIMSDIMTLHK